MGCPSPATKTLHVNQLARPPHRHSLCLPVMSFSLSLSLSLSRSCLYSPSLPQFAYFPFSLSARPLLPCLSACCLSLYPPPSVCLPPPPPPLSLSFSLLFCFCFTSDEPVTFVLYCSKRCTKMLKMHKAHQ